MDIYCIFRVHFNDDNPSFFLFVGLAHLMPVSVLRSKKKNSSSALSRIYYYLTSKVILLAKLQERQGPQPPRNVGPDLFSVMQEHVLWVALEMDGRH